MEKTKIMVANICTHVKILVNTRFYIFRKGVGSNLIFWTKCQLWIYKTCSGVAIYLKNEPRYRYKTLIKIWAPVLSALWRLVDGRPEKQLTLKDAKLDVVESFRYLGGILFPVGGCELTRIVRTRAAWGEDSWSFSLLTSISALLARCGKLYVNRGTLPHASECWLLCKYLECLWQNEWLMLSWMWKFNVEDKGNLSAMYSRLNLPSLESKARLIRVRWYSEVTTSWKKLEKPGITWKKRISHDLLNLLHLSMPWISDRKTSFSAKKSLINCKLW